jgi:hypothetical protein
VNRTFRALATVVSLDIDDELPCASLLGALVASYSMTRETADLKYRVESRGVWRNDVLIDVDDVQDLVPQFERDLYEQIVARAPAGWLLHAAAIEVEGQAIVFAGASGAGKTTLTLALVARGHRLLTEELVWIDASGSVRGLSRPLGVLATSVQPVPAHWLRVTYPLRTRDGISTHHLAIPPEQEVTQEALPLSALVGLTHGPDRIAGLTRYPPHTALQRFWDTTLRQDDDALRVATGILRGYPAYRLASTSFGEALSALQTLVPSSK